MRVLLDTSTVLRVIDAADARHRAVCDCVERQAKAGRRLCIAPQIIYETWATLTRPRSAQGFGLDAIAAKGEIDLLLVGYKLVADPAGLFARWLMLCTTHRVHGRNSYDARIAAFMQGVGITHLVTLNTDDFRKYAFLAVEFAG